MRGVHSQSPWSGQPSSTDAPLDAKNLQRLAARAVFALARTGSTYSNGSGDFAIAFSTHPSLRVTGAADPQTRTILPTDGVSGLLVPRDAHEQEAAATRIERYDRPAAGVMGRGSTPWD